MIHAGQTCVAFHRSSSALCDDAVLGNWPSRSLLVVCKTTAYSRHGATMKHKAWPLGKPPGPFASEAGRDPHNKTGAMILSFRSNLGGAVGAEDVWGEGGGNRHELDGSIDLFGS